MKRTKIVCTLGPASNTVEKITELAKNGMDAARINFSHGDYESHAVTINNLKQVREALNLPIPLILDTKGPEIRIKKFKDNKKIYLESGNIFTLTNRDIEGTEEAVSVTYANLPNELEKNSRVLIDDGLVELKVLEIKNNTDIKCEVINGGFVSSNKGVNIPDVYVDLPVLTQKDIDDLKFGIKMGFDYVAASFIRSAADVLKIRRVLEENGGSDVAIISKIENREGVKNIDDIIAVSDGIMVARGDLGVEIPIEEVPLVQKELIKKATDSCKTVITATQMLESMVSNPRPTRAEANDVANAIFDGTDAIMLSGETANGSFPTEAVQIMAKIAETTENSMDYSRNLKNNFNGMHKNMTNAISYAACTTAAELNTSCIATVTKTGLTAKMIAKYKPVCPIAASSSSERVWRQLNLVWGCKPVLEKEIADNNKVFDLALSTAVKSGLAQNGDTVVIAIGVPVGVSGSTNTLRIDIVGNVICKGTGIGERCVSGKAAVIKYSGEAEKKFKTGDILVTNKVDNSVLPYIKRASALVIGPVEKSHYENAELISNILEIPVIMCEINVTDLIKHETLITVDSNKGFVYFGMPERK